MMLREKVFAPSPFLSRGWAVVSELFTVPVDGCDLAAERWPGDAPVVVLLHEGVSDRRGWREMAGCLAPEFTVVAYDRRGHGQTPPSGETFSHLNDLMAVLGQVADGPAWLVGAPAGGGLALDTALAAPQRVAGCAARIGGQRRPRPRTGCRDRAAGHACR